MLVDDVPEILRPAVAARLVEIDLEEATAVAEEESAVAKAWSVLSSLIRRDLTAELGEPVASELLRERLPLSPPAGFSAATRSWHISLVGDPFHDADDDQPSSERVVAWYARSENGEWRRQPVQGQPYSQESPGVGTMWLAIVAERGAVVSQQACVDIATACAWLVKATR